MGRSGTQGGLRDIRSRDAPWRRFVSRGDTFVGRLAFDGVPDSRKISSADADRIRLALAGVRAAQDELEQSVAQALLNGPLPDDLRRARRRCAVGRSPIPTVTDPRLLSGQRPAQQKPRTSVETMTS